MKTPVALTAGLLAALALGGCVTSDPASQTPVSAPATDVGPGSAQADGTSAGLIFSSVCADTAPSFRQAPAILAKMPFRQHPATGTYYHQNLDLSVKLMPKRCSMVFSSRESPLQLGLGLAAFAAVDSGSNQMGIDPDTGASATKGKGGTAFEFAPLGRANGRNMYRAVLIAP